jgi:hypothetical protein
MFGDDSTIYRHFRRWRLSGIFAQVWEMLLEECEDLASVDWESASPGLLLHPSGPGVSSSGEPESLPRARY